MQITQQYVTLLTGSPDTIMNWRVIHDTDKSLQGHNITGSLVQVYETLKQYNQQGWGVFVCVNATDGKGQKLENIHHIRTHVADLDNTMSSNAMLAKAIASQPAPHFYVNTSPNKYHIYWLVEPYTGNDYYTTLQRKIKQVYDGDKSVTDATRVLRVPGFYHNKAEPTLVTLVQLSNEPRINVQTLNSSFANVNVLDHSINRQPLGSPDLAAPSLDWLKYAMTLIDPNDMDRQEWLSFSCAVKQAGWTLTDEETLYQLWLDWCAQYGTNDEGENRKLWNSLQNTQVGWKTLEIRSGVTPYIKFGFDDPSKLITQPLPSVTNNGEKGGGEVTPEIQNAPSFSLPDPDKFPELLSGTECQQWFKDCVFVSSMGRIFSPSGRYMDSNKFNGSYGGKQFIITQTNGKITDEPWKAALRSTLWTIPKVDHVRFLPEKQPYSIIEDGLGRKGLNTYIPVRVDAREGDVSIWERHMELILPVKSDRDLILSYMAHCIKYPGYKIPWAPLLQSAEGVGKTAFFEIMQHALGQMYVYSPKAQELISSGSKFNAWMRGKLAIIVNEIKVDERRELVEILKPMITDATVEIQSKGVDQEMEDNVANWIFFSNFKDAIPINSNGRRYAVFFSAIQNKMDLERNGMDKAYFDNLWGWLRDGGGLQALTYWFLNHPIKRGEIPQRAPETSSHDEAIMIGRSPLEIVIDNCIRDNAYGFRNGFISSAQLIKHARDAGLRSPTEHTLNKILEERGYYNLGIVPEPIFNESADRLFNVYSNDYNRSAGEYKDSQI